jgi:hypothetical protein
VKALERAAGGVSTSQEEKARWISGREADVDADIAQLRMLEEATNTGDMRSIGSDADVERRERANQRKHQLQCGRT